MDNNSKDVRPKLCLASINNISHWVWEKLYLYQLQFILLAYNYFFIKGWYFHKLYNKHEILQTF
jgi:hypothetical protein